MKNTKTGSAIFLTLLLLSFSFLSSQVIAKTETPELTTTQHKGPAVMVFPMAHNFWFWNVGNETIYNLTASIHIYGGICGHVNRQVKISLGVFPINDMMAIDYVSFSHMFGFGHIDFNVSISCHNMTGIPYTIYPGHITFSLLSFIYNDARILPIQ